MELGETGSGYLRACGLIMHVNKVHHVTTIARVASDLGEDKDWLFDVATEMEPEDGLIWVYGAGDDGAMAFTDFGIENLRELIKIHKDDPTLLTKALNRGLRRMDTDKPFVPDFHPDGIEKDQRVEPIQRAVLPVRDFRQKPLP